MCNVSNLEAKLESVTDRASFISFVKLLIADRESEVAVEIQTPSSSYGPGSNRWENGSIETFLESAVALTEDYAGKEHELPEEPSWSSFAKFLYAGKHYE